METIFDIINICELEMNETYSLVIFDSRWLFYFKKKLSTVHYYNQFSTNFCSDRS